MEKGFLSQITEKMDGYDLHLFIKKKGDIISVIVSPTVQGKDKDYLPPITMSGKANELDGRFLEDITKATEITSSVISDLENFEQEMKKKKEKVTEKKAETSKSSTSKKKVKVKKKELTPAEKTKKNLDQATSYFDRKRYKQAITCYEEALKTASGKEKESIKELQMNAKVKLKAAQEDCTYVETDDLPDPIETAETTEVPESEEEEETEESSEETETEEENSDAE
jgi:PRTRC genetic system protein E